MDKFITPMPNKTFTHNVECSLCHKVRKIRRLSRTEPDAEFYCSDCHKTVKPFTY